MGGAGHDSWSAYCAAELPELRMVKLPPCVARRERAAALREAGASIPEIVVAIHACLGRSLGN
jgi:hypothetical protein